ncbi:MAG: hypothetical protein HC906_16695 [Bacteroidales bacterium]|nr:hypothetical protein [Bacteroidales bacterium]
MDFYSGIFAGYRAFNIMPLSTDQVWSPVQALLDIEAIEDAFSVFGNVTLHRNYPEIVDDISHVIQSNSLFAEQDDTMLNMQVHYYTDMLHRRFFTSEMWSLQGAPNDIDAIQEKYNAYLAAWNYEPDMNRFNEMLNIYFLLCKKFNVEPIEFE